MSKDRYSDTLAFAQKVVEEKTSPRARELRELWAYVKGTQYDHKPNFFIDSNEIPLWDRAPCIVSPLVLNAIQANGDLVLGEGKFPAAKFEGDEAGDDSEALSIVEKKSRLRKAAREVFTIAQGAKSCAAILSIRANKLAWSTVHPSKCEPEFDADGNVTKLTVEYPYVGKTKVEGGDVIAVPLLYRRVIDTKSDTTYFPRRADIDEPPRPDPSQTYAHGFGFCPVIWYPHMKECDVVGDYDGRAIHEQLLDEILGYDLCISQKHRAALYGGDPQIVEMGVSPGYNPTEPVNTTVRVAASVDGQAHESEATSAYVAPVPKQKKGRKKSTGVVWQYPDPTTKVEILALPGEALDVLQKHGRELKSTILDGLGVVVLDAEAIAELGKLSGRALDGIYEKHRNRCDQYREDFADGFLRPAWKMLLRAAARLPKLLKGKTPDPETEIELSWGEYSKPDPLDQQMIVDLVVTAYALRPRLITRRAAVTMLRGILGVDNVDQYLEQLEEADTEDDAADERAAEIEASMKPTPAQPKNAQPTK